MSRDAVECERQPGAGGNKQDLISVKVADIAERYDRAKVVFDKTNAKE
jgi:hypothetical protein